jgi:hypothetical protein
MKIQEMAFVLMAIMIFFAMVAMIYISISMNNLKKDAGQLRAEEAMGVVRKLSAAPEFMLTSLSKKCSSCIDMDKVMALKGRADYQGFWNLDRLVIKKVYPAATGECTPLNYPDCETITLINKTSSYIAQNAYVSLCHWDSSGGGYLKCEIGQIFAAGRTL